MLGRHADVVAALAHDGIVVPGGGGRGPRDSSVGRQARPVVDLGGLPLGGVTAAFSGPVDLLEQVASPWGLALAMSVTQAPPQEVERLRGWARLVFRGAADARVFGVSQPALEATSALAAALGGPQGPWRAQAFVALAETLPGLLAGIWCVLARHPEVVRAWNDRAASRSHMVDELIRVASPSRLVFRRAASAVEIGGVLVPEGASVQLALGAANHDPEVFPDPHRPRMDRGGPAPISFGRGPHACPGAALVRRAAVHATEQLLDGAEALSLAGPVTWAGHAIRAPVSLPARLIRAR